MDENTKNNGKFKLGLVPRLVIGITIGILLGNFAPDSVNRLVITFSTIFGSLLRFVIPLMILAFVTMGISDLTKGAGRLLGMTASLSYLSTMVAGGFAYIVASTFFPSFLESLPDSFIVNPEAGMLAPFFTIPLPPVLDVMPAIVLAFMLGVSISKLRRTDKLGDTLHDFFAEFSQVISYVLEKVIIPFLPLFICGTFINLTKSGTTLAILDVLWRVFLIVIILHFLYLLIMFIVSASVCKKNPFTMMKNQIPGYISAFGTQSSVATIPVNLECAKRNGVSKEIRSFAIPLCANIHLSGSMITVTCCITAVLLMFNMPISPSVLVPFIFVLGIVMVAAPGAPGGAIMTALPFFSLVGIEPDGAIASLLIALYITQDSFGTACNISGDNAIVSAVDLFYQKRILRKTIDMEQLR